MQLFTMLGIILKNLFSEENDDKSNLRIVAAFSVLLLGIKFFDWLKLFGATSFYIRLLNETFDEIAAFMYLFFAALFMFGCSLYLLSLNQAATDKSIL